MANVPQTSQLIVIAQNYRDNIVRNINRQSALVRLLEWRRGEGNNAAFVAEGDGMVAELYSEGADVANYGSDAQAGCMIPWGLARANFAVTGLALGVSNTARTPEGNVDLWSRNIVNAGASLASLINSKFYNSTSNIIGLVSAIGSTTNTYGGIDRSDATKAFFRPTVISPGTPTALTLALLRDDVRKIQEASGHAPDVALCSPSVFNAIGALFDATRRNVASVVNTARGKIDLDVGFHGLELDGMVFIKDKDCTANTIYYINTNYVHVQYIPQNAPPGIAAMQVQVDDGYGVGPMPMGMTVENLAKTGDSDKGMCKSYLQLVVTRPNACGTRTNIAVS